MRWIWMNFLRNDGRICAAPSPRLPITGRCLPWRRACCLIVRQKGTQYFLWPPRKGGAIYVVCLWTTRMLSLYICLVQSDELQNRYWKLPVVQHHLKSVETGKARREIFLPGRLIATWHWRPYICYTQFIRKQVRKVKLKGFFSS